MQTVSVNEFRDHLKHYADTATLNHEPIKVARRNGEDFVIVGLQDWQQEQETLYVLQNQSLMQQVAESMQTFRKGQGKRMKKAQQDEIDRI